MTVDDYRAEAAWHRDAARSANELWSRQLLLIAEAYEALAKAHDEAIGDKPRSGEIDL